MASPTRQYVELVAGGGARHLLISSQTSGLVADALATSTPNVYVSLLNTAPPAGDGYSLVSANGGTEVDWQLITTDLTDAVILAPGSSTRNVIQPTGNFTNLVLKAQTGQTAEHLDIRNSVNGQVGYINGNGVGATMFFSAAGAFPVATFQAATGYALDATGSAIVVNASTSGATANARAVRGAASAGGTGVEGLSATGIAGYFTKTNADATNAVVKIRQLGTSTAKLLQITNGAADVDLITFSSLGGAIFNEQGLDADFRVEGLSRTSLLHTDASTDRVGINTSTPDTTLQVVGDMRTGEDTANYTNWDTTGHQTMVGTAKPWDDLRIEPVARNTGANAPAFEKWYDDLAGTSRGVNLYSFDDVAAASEKEVFFTMQMPHSWDSGTINMHVHWVGAVDDTTAAPRWGLEYVWKDIGEVFGDTTTVYTDGTNIVPGGTDADVTAGKHYIASFGTLAPGTSADGISSVLIGRLFRNSSDAADTYNAAGAKCGLLYIDAHFQLSSIGSNDEYTK